MIVERRLEKNLLENFDYEEEEEDKCDLDTRPLDKEQCNSGPCSEILPRFVAKKQKGDFLVIIVLVSVINTFVYERQAVQT